MRIHETSVVLLLAATLAIAPGSAASTSLDEGGITVTTAAGDAEIVVRPSQLNDTSPLDQLPDDDPEEEEGNGCNPYCLPLSAEDGQIHVDGTVAEATIVVQPSQLDDPEEEEGNGCNPYCLPGAGDLVEDALPGDGDCRPQC